MPPRLHEAARINRVLVVCLIATSVWHWRLFATVFRVAPGSLLGVLLLLLWVLLAGSVIGLARASRRGYYFTYGLVLYATMFHGLPLVPVVTSLLPTQMLRSGSVFVLNLGFLSAAIASHRLLESSDRNPMAAPPRRTRT